MPTPPPAQNACFPFVRAEDNPGCELFWIGIPAFPAPLAHRTWLIEFFMRFNQAVAGELKVRGEFFLQFKTVVEIERRFRRLASEIAPWPGLSRRPGAKIPNPPTKEQLEAAIRGEPFDIRRHFPDACFWLRSEHGRLFDEFFGLGGTSMYYLPPDAAAAPPVIPYLDELKLTFPQLDFNKLTRLTAATASLREPFLAASKKLFGPGLEDEPSWEGISFILPLLETRDFFTQPAAEKQKWFELFDVFWRESRRDLGLYIASSKPIEAMIVSLVEAMRKDGLFHPTEVKR